MLFLRLFLTLLIAVYHFSSSQASAEPQEDRTLPPQVHSVPSKAGPALPLLKESDIKEEDLQESLPTPPASGGPMLPGGAPTLPAVPDKASPAEPVGETVAPREGFRWGPGALPGEKGEHESTVVRSRETASLQPDGPSLIAKITSQTPPRRAASLRLTEEGRRLLEMGEYEKALERFEKTIAVDSTNPYSHYYMARAHHHLAHYRQSFNFLDVAESLLSEEPYWLAQVFALKGKNFQALRFFERADASFAQALKLDPNNQAALEAITRLGEEQERSLQ
ncbi:MAG: tetratricopeptide repeat protein [Candidatus Binatia bacterium]